MNKSIQKGSRLALFDFDGTLCRLNSYHVFLRWLMRHPTPTSLRLLSTIALRKAGLVTRPALMGMALQSLKGKTRGEIELIGKEIFETKIVPNLNEIGISEMQKRRTDGYDLIVLSGAFDFILKPFCDLYGIDHWRSTRIAYVNSICSGRLEGEEFLGEAKRLYLQGHFIERNIDWAESCAYSDELVDLPLFSMVGTKIFVAGKSQQQIALPDGIQHVFW
jgi:phosphatidylglycerophosphatase C